jgi:hypothetical protein
MANDGAVVIERLLAEREASEMLGCSVALLRKMRRHGNGPTYCKIGSLVRYPLADLQVFIHQRRVESELSNGEQQ